MIDREKVIKGLECCTNQNVNCKAECPYYGAKPRPEMDCFDVVKKDALALLKAQAANSACTKERCPMNASTISDDCNIETCLWRTEALIPRLSMSGLWYECPSCGRHLTKALDNYCGRCGRRVKWE